MQHKHKIIVSYALIINYPGFMDTADFTTHNDPIRAFLIGVQTFKFSISACVRACVRVCMRACVCTYLRRYVRKYVHTYVYKISLMCKNYKK